MHIQSYASTVKGNSNAAKVPISVHTLDRVTVQIKVYKVVKVTIRGYV